MKTLIAIGLLASSSAFALDIKSMEVDKPVNCALLEFVSEEASKCGKELEWSTTLDFMGKPTPALISQNKQGILKSIVLVKFEPKKTFNALMVQYGNPVSVSPYETVWVKGNKSIRIVNNAGFGPMLVYSGKAAEKQ